MDAWRRVSTWLELQVESVDNAALFAAIHSLPVESAGSVVRLRKLFSAERIAAATELLAARKKAAGKLDFSWPLFVDREGVEMASSTLCARWKAARFEGARVSGERVLDLVVERSRGILPADGQIPSLAFDSALRSESACGGSSAGVGDQQVLDLFSGIGADLHALVEVCGEESVLGVELDPLRAWMACSNARGRVREADARSEEVQLMIPSALVHCDPPRRDAAGRAWKRGEETSDAFDLATLLAWMRAAKGGALKLGPGVARELVTAADAECEYIEVDGVMEQCVVWTGALASNAGTTRATQLGGAAITRFGVPRGVPQADALGAYLFEPCASIERAGLLADLAQELDAAEVAPGLGLLTGNVAHTSRWAECFDIAGTVAQTPNAAVSQRFSSVAQERFRSVRVRGKALDTLGGADKVTRELDCQSNGTLVLFGWRRGAKAACVVARVRVEVKR